MNIGKTLVNGLVAVLVLVLLLLPLGLIVRISQAEMEEFATPTVPLMEQTAVGGIVQSYTGDVSECFYISGTFVSAQDAFQDLDYANVGSIRWLVKVGDEIQVGQVLGTGASGDVISTQTGILKEMHLDNPENCYLRVELFTPVVFACKVDDQTLSMLKFVKTLTVGSDKATLTLVFASQTKNPDGTTNVKIAINSDQYFYGQQTSLTISTGRQFKNAILLDERCVYQKGGVGDYYVRQVTEDGIFIKEIKVTVGVGYGSSIVVSGIEAGQYFDTGYKFIAEGG